MSKTAASYDKDLAKHLNNFLAQMCRTAIEAQKKQTAELL
jgi:hypothetical protein